MVAKSAHDRKYDYAHKKRRKQWVPIVEAGGVRCHRCNKPIQPGTPWHLDHHDDGSGSSPSHRACNAATARIWRDKALGIDSTPNDGYCPCGQPYAWFTCTSDLPHRPLPPRAPREDGTRSIWDRQPRNL